jgi:hypothetical protein
MPRWAEILLVILAVFVLVTIAIGVGGYFFVSRHKDAWVAEAKKVAEEGKTFGAGKEGSQCLDEALRRLKDCNGIICEARVRLFLSSCLPSAGPSPELCTNAPPRSQIVRSATWAVNECGRRGMSASQPCTRLMQETLKYCDSEASKR